jgi:hypothetical protein
MYYPAPRNSTTALRVLVGTMNRAPRAASFQARLWRNPGGSFTARGLLATEFSPLSPEGEETGRLRLPRASEAESRSGGYVATFEASGKRYRMVVNGEEALVAGTKGRSLTSSRSPAADKPTRHEIGFFHTLALASYPSGERAVRLSGGLMGRSYKAFFAAEDSCALPVAIFLLWHLAANRRRAYRTGNLMGE